MATIQSLGLHQPSALPYLIAESILPPEPHPSSYQWRSSQTYTEDGSQAVEEEILITASCVVWSKCGVVKRVLNLHFEDETVLQAFTTTLTRRDETGQTRSESGSASGQRERALVAILRTQAHIYFLSGDSHVLPLSFEVDCAFPCPFGFILQRKSGSNNVNSSDDTTLFNQDLSTINESLGTIKDSSGRPSLLLPNAPQPVHRDDSRIKGMPRTFSFTETMSELGVVVHSSFARPQTLDECKALPVGERILYVSDNDELHAMSEDHQALCIAVTVDASGSNFTVWQVAKEAPAATNLGSRKTKEGQKSRSSRRKSSNIYGRGHGTTTPATRGPAAFRESFGALAQSYSENIPHSSTTDQKSFATEDLATQLGPEFGEVGVQTRSARRVSSMLARTDLAAGNDRNTFNDLAVGHGSRKSFNRIARRGESIGSFSDRQSFGFRRRSSFPASNSILSNGTSILGVPGLSNFDDISSFHPLDGLDGDGWTEVDSELPREIGFFKIKSFPRSGYTTNGSASASFKIMTLLSPTVSMDGSKMRRDLSICFMDMGLQQMVIVNVLIKFTPSMEREIAKETPGLQLKATSIRRGSGITDASVITDGQVQRLVILSKSRSGHVSLQLEAPWTSSFRLELPSSYAIFSPFATGTSSSPKRSRDVGSNRVLQASGVEALRVQGVGGSGHMIVSDASLQNHLLAARLAPKDPLVYDILSMSNVVLGEECNESLLLAFWEVSRWLKEKEKSSVSDWTVLVIVLFALAVPFIDDHRLKSPSHNRRKKGSLLRSSSGVTMDLTSWNNMHENIDNHANAAMQSVPWAWLSQSRLEPISPTRPSKYFRSQSSQISNDSASNSNNSMLLQFITWARDFMQSPTGETAIGPEGYLPISVSKARSTRQTALAKILVGMHLLCEERKLNVTADCKFNASSMQMTAVLAQLGQWLGWTDWTLKEEGYYINESAALGAWLVEDSRITGLATPPQPFRPPSVFEYVANCITGRSSVAFPTLEVIADEPARTKFEAGYSPEIVRLTPRTHALISFLNDLQRHSRPLDGMESVLNTCIDLPVRKTLPDGIAAVFQQALASRRICQSLVHTDKSKPSLGLEARSAVAEPNAPGRSAPHPFHEASKDYHSIGVAALEADGLQRWDASSEADRHNITRLVFHEDRRFQEASKLVNQTRPPVVECTPEPEWSEAELLEAQKELAQFVTRRTLSVAAGRGMIHFNARVPLLTERVPIPAFSLQCVMKPRHTNESTQAMTFSADKAVFTEDKVCWAFFHNGASAGLMISKDVKGIDTSWILYNKPPELTNRHAGFLLALGLNGHLKSLAKWVAFKYLTPKHTMTSVGLLLGLSVSYLGTMDTLITRLLSVHITRLLPPGAAELNLSPLTQTTGIMGIGLLYHSSQHRRMSEVMLSEIGNNDSEEGIAEDSVLRDEGYRLAAGFSLGLINLGQGNRLHGLHDMGVLERLLTIAIGTKNVNLVHVLDRATAGAVMAVAFLFLKTNDEAVARKIDIPDTIHQFDYVRPDIFLLRTLARHLILWDSISPTLAFVQASLPRPYRHRASLVNTKYLSTEDMPLFNIIAGICFALSLRFAGTQLHKVRDLLISYLDQFLRISRLPAMNYDARVTLNSVRNCLDLVALATATVMAGSGDLMVMRRLRALHGRTDGQTPFGSHLAAHMALGALFLGGGTSTFGTSDLATASLCIAFYPLFPTDVLDNRSHLQALRHLWVLAVEGRCLVARSADTATVIGGIEGTVHLTSDAVQVVRAPGLLPAFDNIARIDVRGEGYWDVSIDFTNPATRTRVQTDQAVNVLMHRRAAYDKPAAGDVLVAELAALDEANGGVIPSVNPNVAARSALQGAGGPRNPFEWLFGLESFRDYDFAEKALVLNHQQLNAAGVGEGGLMDGTVLDTRLQFERGILPDDRPAHRAVGEVMKRDQLWQLRLLFAWVERWDREAATTQSDIAAESTRGNSKDADWSNGTWLRREVIDRLKDRVWNMMASDGDGGDIENDEEEEDDDDDDGEDDDHEHEHEQS